MNKIDKCLCCESSDLTNLFRLNDAPLTDAYKKDFEESMNCEKYPLNVLLCNHCNHVQLERHVEPQLSYSDYLYTSSVTLGLNKNFLEYAKSIKDFHPQVTKPLLLDIGSNDGSFLFACFKAGISAYGIEPAKNLTQIANSNCCKTVHGFFNKETIELLKEESNADKFDIITFNNVLANISNPLEILSLARTILKSKNSNIVIQTGYHPIQFGRGLFDYIYHEHYSYFCLKSMEALASRCSLKIIKQETFNLRGGSLRVTLAPSESKQFEAIPVVKERFDNYRELMGMHKLVEASKTYLSDYLKKLKDTNVKVIGYGASHSTGILVHHFGIQEDIDILVDENSQKFGRYMPGTNLQVEDPSIIKTAKNACIIILAWQYFDNIYNKIIDAGFEGEIIKPVLP